MHLDSVLRLMTSILLMLCLVYIEPCLQVAVHFAVGLSYIYVYELTVYGCAWWIYNLGIREK